MNREHIVSRWLALLTDFICHPTETTVTSDHLILHIIPIKTFISGSQHSHDSWVSLFLYCVQWPMKKILFHLSWAINEEFIVRLLLLEFNAISREIIFFSRYNTIERKVNEISVLLIETRGLKKIESNYS